MLFRSRARDFFPSDRMALAFYRDYFELMRRICGEHFDAARLSGHLVGLLLLTTPQDRIVPALLNGGFAFRLAGNAIVFRYGVVWQIWKRALGALLLKKRGAFQDERLNAPHVDVVLVANGFEGHGIGTELLKRARQRCENSYDRIWLSVERDNTRAIQAYEKVGYQKAIASGKEVAMIQDLGHSGSRP